MGGRSFRFRGAHFAQHVPHTSCLGNEFSSLCAGCSRPVSGSARRSGRGVCGPRFRSQQPRHGRVGPARQRSDRMAPRRWGTRESPGAVPETDGNGHGHAGSPFFITEICPTPVGSATAQSDPPVFFRLFFRFCRSRHVVCQEQQRNRTGSRGLPFPSRRRAEPIRRGQAGCRVAVW